MKKALKIFASILAILFILLLISPFLFKGKIEKIVKKQINEQVYAEVNWDELNLSLIRNFPNASIQIKGFRVVNEVPFEGDTLANIGAFEAKMGLLQLFKSEGISVDEIALHEARFNIKIDSLGNANYDIAKESTSEKETSDEPSELQLNISHYEINHSSLSYVDEASKIHFQLNDFNHRGDGNFDALLFDLNTHTDTHISLSMGGTNYIDNHSLQLDATIGIDMEQMKFSFKENEALINQLKLAFDGFVQLQEEDIVVNMSFETPSTDFKNFLALVPEAYATDLNQVNTTGNFSVKGNVNGAYNENRIPAFSINIGSEKASFAYVDLPKKVTNINFLINIENEVGNIDNTLVEIPNFGFQIDEDVFSGKLKLNDLTTDMKVDLMARGRINLANIDRAYPLEEPLGLTGIINADLQTRFAMDDIEKERYERVTANGNFRLSNFVFESEDLIHPYDIKVVDIGFSNKDIRLREFDMKTGQTDVMASGRLDNLLGFMFAKQDLRGRFSASSSKFYVSDFMVAVAEEETSPEASGEAIKIPDFLDLALDFSANDVYYDQMRLQNASGSLIIKNEAVRLEDISANIFGGTISLKGMVSTKDDTPDFAMQIGLGNVDIGQIFQQMDLAKRIAPIASALTGRVNTNLDLNGKLTPDFSPVLESLGGGVLASVIQAKVNPEQTPLLNNLNNELNFIDFSKINLNNLTTQASFNNGQLDVQPFNFAVEGVNVTTKGSHRFDGSMDYTMDVKVPAQLLGSSISQQIANLSQQDLQGMSLDVPVGIGGSFTSPRIQLNVQNAINDLTKQIIDAQKERLKNEVRDRAQDKVEDKIRGLLGGEKYENNDDERKLEEEVKDKAKDILGGFLRGNK